MKFYLLPLYSIEITNVFCTSLIAYFLPAGDKGYCESHMHTLSARRKTTTPTSAWVASKAIHHLRKKITTGIKDLLEILQDEHKCQIHYDTIWKGRKIALTELYSNWEESFQMPFNWRAEVLKRSLGSVIEIGLEKVGGKFYFHRFFLCTEALH